MRIISLKVADFIRFLGVVALLTGLAACETTDGSAAETATSTPAPAHYPSFTQQFVELTKAAINADYPAFAKHIRAGDPAPVVEALTKSFDGRPFDAYTRSANFTTTTFVRLVELRSTTGRLYLFLAMNKSGTGWNVSDYTLTRRRAEAEARMTAPLPSS